MIPRHLTFKVKCEIPSRGIIFNIDLQELWEQGHQLYARNNIQYSIFKIILNIDLQELWEQGHQLYARNPRLEDENSRTRTVPICFAQEIR